MVGVIVRHRVADYAAWKPVFDEHEATRRKHGAVGHHVFRLASDPQEVIVVNLYRDAAGAQAFAADPSLREAMHRGGVVSEPEVLFCEHAESSDYQVPVGS